MQKTCILLILLWAFVAEGKLRIVTTLPDFASIAREVGRDLVDVESIAKGTEDAHFIDARPSFIRLLNRADLLIEGGAELEIGWLPPLLEGARNRKITGNSPGHLVLAAGMQLLDVPDRPVDRSMGDVHTRGNPHFWLDPENGKRIAQLIADRLAELDKSAAASYRQNLQAFTTRLDAKIQQWNAAMKPFAGTPLLTYHKSYDYLAQRFGLKIIGQLEPRPGIEPKPSHLNALIPRARQDGVKLVLIEPFRPRRTPEYVAAQTNAKLVVLPDKVGAHQKADSYIALFDLIVQQLSSALKASS